MTCIIGIAQGGKTYIGGDAAASSMYRGEHHTRTDPKVFLRNGYAFGYTSSFRMGDILEYRAQAPEPKPQNMSLRNHLIVSWIDYLRSVFKRQGYLTIDKNSEEGGTFLIGYKGELCIVESNFQVGTPSQGFHSVGSGASVAFGALYSLKDYRLKPEKKIRRALEAAVMYTAFVLPPFTIVVSE